jgi:tRNA(fMet)-specific endonuclease VapC
MIGKKRRRLRWRLKKIGRSFLKNKVLVDTNIWIEFFRPGSEFGRHVEILLEDNAVWTCGIVMFEVLKGIRSEEEKSKILNIFGILPYTEMTRLLWQKASWLSVDLRKKGLNLPNSDIFIATIALERDQFIFTLDKHFNQIADLKLYEKTA